MARWTRGAFTVLVGALAFMLALAAPSVRLHAQGEDGSSVPMRPPSGAAFYASYRPFECIAAVTRAYQVLHRAQDDTLHFTEPSDTMPTSVRSVAKECAEHLSTAHVDPAQVPALLALYVSAGDSVRADTIQGQIMGHARTPGERASAFVDVTKAFNLIPVFPVSRLVSIMAQLDAIPGAASAAQRVGLHYELAMYDILFRVTQDSMARVHLDAALSAGRELDAEGRVTMSETLQNCVALQQFLAMLNGDSTVRGPAPAVSGDVILGPPGVRPTPGRATLLVFRDGTTRQSVAALRRIKAKFGDSVEIVFLGKTLGYFKMRGPFTPDSEAVILKNYYRDDLQVPGPVLLERTAYRVRADGRVFPQPTTNDTRYPQMALVVVDQAGRIRLEYKSWGSSFEVRLERTISRIIGSHGVTQ